MTDIRSLRIMFLSSTSGRSGTYFRAFLLGKHLVRRGHEVLLVVSSNKTTLGIDRKVVDGVNIYSLPLICTSKLLLASMFKISTTMTQTLFNCILEMTSDFDILHSFDVVGPQNATPILISKLSRFLRFHGKRIFVDWDEWWGRGGIYSFSGFPWMIRLSEGIVTFLEEKMPLYADALTVSSEGLRQRALSLGVKLDNLFLISNSANVEFIKPLNMHDARKRLNLPISNIIYSHFGSLEPRAFRLLLQAHKKVVEEFPEAILMLGALPTHYRDHINSVNMSKNVICVERQPYYEYSLYLAASDILLLPMQDRMLNRVRWPLRLGDYLAAGKPIIATDLPIIREIVSACGSLAQPGDPEDFASKLSEIVKDPDLRAEMGKKARRLAELKYSWKIAARQLEKAYNRYL